MGLSGESADLLGTDDSEVSKSGESDRAEHPGRVVTVEDFIVDVGRILNT